MRRVRRAPAKINLFLHVGPPGPDGYHPIASWMSFADLGDELALEPAPAWSFAVEGPFAADLGGGENLVETAARRLFEVAGVAPPPLRLTLTKQLPVAAGLGGGSSDAAAALRLLGEALPWPVAEEALAAIAEGLGADGAAAFAARPILAEGRGERLSPAPDAPALPVVLANPGRPSSTAAVYRAYDQDPAGAAELPRLPRAFADVAAVAAALRPLRNDLEAPAVRLEPAIGEVLAQLRGAPETRLARLSGSGATAFALCASRAEADALARRLAQARPDWWVRSTMLLGQVTKS